ncbi:MAG: hypothetical protein DRP55_04950, partial [Spirochaetes bacterium]
LKNVRRKKVGDNIKALIEDEVAILYIIEIDKNRMVLEIVDKGRTCNTIRPRIAVFQGLIKSKKMDLLISRLSEIGIEEIYPVITERSVLQNGIGVNKVARWIRISKEGSKISGLEQVLKINLPFKLRELKAGIIEGYDIKLLFSTVDDSIHIRTYLEKVNDPINKSFVLFFGPEGGFSQREEIFLLDLGFIRVGMGPFIMRAETAAIAASTFIRIFYSNELFWK